MGSSLGRTVLNQALKVNLRTCIPGSNLTVHFVYDFIWNKLTTRQKWEIRNLNKCKRRKLLDILALFSALFSYHFLLRLVTNLPSFLCLCSWGRVYVLEKEWPQWLHVLCWQVPALDLCWRSYGSGPETETWLGSWRHDSEPAAVASATGANAATNIIKIHWI